MRLGEIWLVNFPFSDATNTELRPVLLVSADKLNLDGDEDHVQRQMDETPRQYPVSG